MRRLEEGTPCHEEQVRMVFTNASSANRTRLKPNAWPNCYRPLTALVAGALGGVASHGRPVAVGRSLTWPGYTANYGIQGQRAETGRKGCCGLHGRAASTAG